MGQARTGIRGAIRTGAALAALLLAPSGAAAGDAATLTAGAARDRLVGNTVEGTTADGPYALFFAPGGRLASLDRDGRVAGTWAFRDGKLCTTLTDEDEECRSLEVQGAAGAFVDADGSRYPFAITPGNPKAL